MADSLFLDDVVGFLHSFDDVSIAGSELVTALDKPTSVSLLPGTEIDLQLVDVSTVDDLFLADTISVQHQDLHAATDSDCTSTECESVASASSPLKTVVVENVRSKDAIRRRCYREKQKAQKDALYQQVQELSTQLSALQRQQEMAKVRKGLGVAPTAMWKALASRHLQGRLAAEEQRRRLHDAVQRRAELIESLGNMIQKRIGDEQTDREMERPRKRVRSQSPDAALFEAYIKELDEVYARVDDVVSETVMPSSSDVSSRYNPQRSASKDASYHELVGKSITPFSFDRVRKFMSIVQCMENRVDDREAYSGPGLSPNTFVVKVRIPGPEGVEPHRSLVQYVIMRKYYESDRVVIICRKFTEGEGAFAGMHADETGWNIVRPSSASVEGGAGTVMESVIRYVPMTFSSAVGADVMMKQFIDLIIKAGEEDCQKCFTRMEETLLDDALGVC